MFDHSRRWGGVSFLVMDGIAGIAAEHIVITHVLVSIRDLSMHWVLECDRFSCEDRLWKG